MDISEAFNDIWPTHCLNYTDYPELTNEQVDGLISLSPELSLSLDSLSTVSSNNVEIYLTDSSTNFNSPNDSNEKPGEIKELSDAIDSHFSSYTQSHDITETVLQPINNVNSFESSSTSLTCYNSNFNSSFDSSTSFNLFPPTVSIDLVNSNPHNQNVQVEPSLSLESMSTISSNDISTSFAAKDVSNEKPREIKELSDAIDSYFSSYNQNHDINESVNLDPQPINNTGSIEYSSRSLSCYISNFNSSLDFPSTASIDLVNSNRNNQNVHFEPSRKVAILAKDCSKVKEPWIPSVAKKLLASYYSPLSIKSELLSNQFMLDAFESLALQEAVQAFSDIAFANPYYDSELYKAIENDFFSDPRPIDLIYSCEKLRAYRKLNTEDKMNLMARAFFDINTVKGAITYDETVDGWIIAGTVFPLKSISWESPNASIVLNLIETFPDCLRNDLNVITLLYLIVIFNPDLPKLKFRNGIRQEQYIYIYLLKRYLMSLFGSTCDALDYHYRLMVKIEQTIKLPETVVFEQIQTGSTKVLKNRVIKLVQHKSISVGNTGN